MDKLVIITGICARKKNLKYIGYDKLKNKKFEVWDISEISGDPSSRIEFHDEVKEGKALEVIESKRKLRSKIKEEKGTPCYWISRMYGESDLKKWIIREIKINGGGLIEKYEFEKIYHGEEPQMGLQTTLWACWKYIKRLLGNIIKRGSEKRSDYIFVPTKRSIRRVDRVGLKTKVEETHTVDYDRYIESKKPTNVGDDTKYALFLDQYIPFHHELKNRFGENWISPQRYYGEVKKMFELVLKDKKNNINSIRISLHPNAKMEKVREYWGKFNISQGQTPSLVKGSNLVMTHMSTSVLFAVMANTPVCVFGVESMLNSMMEKKICSLANLMGVEPNIGPKFDRINYGYDKKRYKKILYNYVKSKKSPDINSCVHVYNTVVEV